MNKRRWLVVFAGMALVSGAKADQTVKDWVFSKLGGGSAIAYTGNDSGSRLGVVCTAANECDAYVYSATGCDDGSKIPVLINTDSGSASFNVTCKNISSPSEKQNFVFVFDELKPILNILLKNQTLGLALPLASGQFKVLHFSLQGSNEALAAVSRSVKPSATPVSTKKNEDQTL